jgi:hypothetical protein
MSWSFVITLVILLVGGFSARRAFSRAPASRTASSTFLPGRFSPGNDTGADIANPIPSCCARGGASAARA